MENQKTFSEWLLEELNARGWNQADLAKRGRINTSTLSRIVSGERNVGNEVGESIARALGYPPEYIFRKAGLLPPSIEKTDQMNELILLFDQLPEDEKDDLLDYLRLTPDDAMRTHEQGSPVELLLK